MVRALAIAVLVSLAACKVGVEGAPCLVAGSADDCPEGQACGSDGRCSERAAGCAPLHWDGSDCRCPPFAGTELVADAARGSAASAAPYATGSLEPAACRFARLTDALTAAAARAPASTVVHTAPEGASVFGDVASGETLPLEVRENVTLRAAAGGALLRVAAATPEQIVRLQGAIEGFRIESTSATGAGIATSCGASGAPPRIVDVAVDGGGLLATGIDVSAGTCGAFLSGVEVTNADGPALRVGGDAAGPAVEVVTGTFSASGSGIVVASGKVVVGVDEPWELVDDQLVQAPEVPPGGVTVAGNDGDGIVLGGSGLAVDASLLELVVERNGGTGIVIGGLDAASHVSVVGCDVSANGAAAARAYGQAQRPAGGVLVAQDPAVELRFVGNRVFGNAGDELAFDTSASSWTLRSGPGSCGRLTNTFACVGEDSAVAVTPGGAVDASRSLWPVTEPPLSWTAYVTGAVESVFECVQTMPGTPQPPEACP